jgi:thymidine kinase
LCFSKIIQNPGLESLFGTILSMAKLYYRFGAMNSGKSTALLQVAHNYRERGQRVIIAKPSIDTKSASVLSRLNISETVNWNVGPDHRVYDFLAAETERVNCILVDEAQFLAPSQVDELFHITVTRNIPVLAYGIRSDFRTKAFPGSARLMEVAHSLEELKTICRCGRKAMFNGRKINGNFTDVGNQVAIDGQDAEYESLCGECYIKFVGWPPAA